MFRLILLALLFALPNVLLGQATFPLRVSADKRYLVDSLGKPFPILGRTAWFIISQSEAGYKKFIDNTLQYGYNSIEMSVITHWPTGNHAPFNAAGDAPFLRGLNGKPWDGSLKYDSPEEAPDLTTPNEKYWTFVDTFLSYCEQKGLAVFMFPAYLGYEGQEQGWMQELVANGSEKTEAYGVWIANRYKTRKNIVWMLLGDMGKFDDDQRVAETALIQGLKSVSGQQSTQYTAESHSGENAADNVDFGMEMTLNGVYTWELSVPVPSLGRKAYAREPVMPAFLLEEPYDEEGPDGNNYNPNATQPVRRFQWWGWLSTIGGYIAGNGYVWQFVDPVWQQHLDTQGARDMGRLNSFIKSIEWWNLVPSGLGDMKTLIVKSYNEPTSASFVAASVAKDGSLLVAYIPPAHMGNIEVDMTALNSSAYAYWYDPTTAKYTVILESPISNAGTFKFNSPGKNSTGEKDWVLVLSIKQIL